MAANEAGGRAEGDPTFDRYASSYEELHANSIRASGEPTGYFAQYKVDCLIRMGAAEPVLDFGCGIGNLTERLVAPYRDVHGYDPSAASLSIARSRAASATFHDSVESISDATFGSAVISGVLHHVPPSERAGLLENAKKKLRPGGRVFIFEHNPFNPLTRRAVAQCEFDCDAQLLWPRQLRKLVQSAGFQNVDLQFIVFFPRTLAPLRPLEPLLRRVGLGAQMMCTGIQPA